MTEEEAKNTRCCGPNGCGEVRDSLRGAPENQERYCIGAACMAWRSEPGADRRRLEAQNPRMPMGEIAKIESGWCGLAGKP